MQHNFNVNEKNDDNNNDDNMNLNKIESNIKIMQFLKRFIIKNKNKLIRE